MEWNTDRVQEELSTFCDECMLAGYRVHKHVWVASHKSHEDRDNIIYGAVQIAGDKLGRGRCASFIGVRGGQIAVWGYTALSERDHFYEYISDVGEAISYAKGILRGEPI